LERRDDIMKRKLIITIIAMLFLASSVMALPTGSAHWSSKEYDEGKFSVQLTVDDGNSRIVAVVIPVDVELKDIAELSFWKKVTEFTSGWNPNVLLGIDLDGDGKYMAKDFAWQFSYDVGYVPELLRGDTFIQGENPTGLTTPETTWSKVNAKANYMWYTANTNGVGYYPFYGSLSSFQTGGGVAGIPINAKVKVIKILIGGSTSWMAEVAFIDCLSLNNDIILDEPNNSKARFEVVTREGWSKQRNGLKSKTHTFFFRFFQQPRRRR
jgi:hypothetical protein